MEDIIKLEASRDETVYLKKLTKPDGIESKTYVLRVSNPSIKVDLSFTGYKSITPSGGSIIEVGVILKEANAVVRSINCTIGYGYTITFE